MPSAGLVSVVTGLVTGLLETSLFVDTGLDTGELAAAGMSHVTLLASMLEPPPGLSADCVVLSH